MKTKEELNALKDEVETLNKKLAELSEDELKQVVGGHPGGMEYDQIRPGILGTPQKVVGKSVNVNEVLT